jgi:hypothetical protein
MRVSVRHIIESVADDFRVDIEEMRSRSRVRRVSWPRQYAMLLARELTDLSYPSLAHIFRLDHSTLVHGVGSAKKRLANDRSLALKIEARAMLLQCEPQKVVDARFIGFPPKTSEHSSTHQQLMHSNANCGPLADLQAVAA